MQSEHINELAAALCKAQMDIQGAKEDSANPFFKSKYADLYQVWQSCKDQLNKNGLCITQTLDYSEEKAFLVTSLLHTSGQWIKSRLPLPQVKPGAQEMGSCITYCRRYALSAIVGICPYDDDGEKAQKEHRPEPKKQEIKPETDKNKLHKKICSLGNLVSAEQLDKFLAFLSEKYSKPTLPYTADDAIFHALENDDQLGKFSEKLTLWLKT